MQLAYVGKFVLNSDLHRPLVVFQRASECTPEFRLGLPLTSLSLLC